MRNDSFKLAIVLMRLCLYFIERRTTNCAYVKFEIVNSKDKPFFSIRVSLYDIVAIINIIVEICIEMQ